MSPSARRWCARRSPGSKINAGLFTHADTATLYEFDLKTEKMRQLAQIAELTGERRKGIWTTRKIHVQMKDCQHRSVAQVLSVWERASATSRVC